MNDELIKKHFKFHDTDIASIGLQWLTPLMIFFFCYGPFILQYGWEYRNYPNSDFPSFYAASVNVFRNGVSPYNLENMRLLMPNIRVFPFLYPPPSLLIFFPLSLLTYANARQVVFLVNHLLFLALIWIIPLRLLNARPKGHGLGVFALCIVYSITFYPVIVTLDHGQVNILLLAFIVLFWLFNRNGNEILAGLFLALAILLKTYPLIIIPMLFLIGRWRESIYGSAWLGLATIVSLAILPNTIWHDWLTNVLPTGGYTSTPAGLFSPAAIWNQGLNGFFARAFTESEWSKPLLVNPGLARLLTYGTAGLIAVASGVAVWRSRMHFDSLDRTILVALPTMYLIAPFSWEHHLVYLLPAILMLLNSRSSLDSMRKIIFYILCFSSAAVISMPHLPQFRFYGVFVLWGLCVFTTGSNDIELPNKCIGSDNE